MHKKLLFGLLILVLGNLSLTDDQDSRWLGISDFASWSRDGSKIVCHSLRQEAAAPGPRSETSPLSTSIILRTN
jgi:hypothetical protein